MPGKCPKCGEMIPEDATRCEYCWTPLIDEKPSHAETSQLAGDGSDKAAQKQSSSLQGTASGLLAKQDSRRTIIAVAVIAAVVLCIVGGMFASNQSANREEYVSTLSSAQVKMVIGAGYAETACNKVVKIWHSAIYNSKKTWDSDIKAYKSSDFNDAIAKYYSAAEGKNIVSSIESNQSEVAELMKKLKNPPSDLTGAYDALNDLYDSYLKLTGLALSPTGNYSEYSSSVHSADSNFSTSYDKLKAQLPD